MSDVSIRLYEFTVPNGRDMNVAEARLLLSQLLRFGDEQQINALRVLEKASEKSTERRPYPRELGIENKHEALRILEGTLEIGNDKQIRAVRFLEAIGDAVDCETCDNEGRIECEECGGEGYVDCPDCNPKY